MLMKKPENEFWKSLKKNDYIPSAMAIGLSNKNSYTIGWILPKADNIFFGEVTQGIYEVLANTQYSLVLSCTQNEIEYELKALKIMRQQNIKGLLITTSSGYVDDRSFVRPCGYDRSINEEHILERCLY